MLQNKCYAERGGLLFCHLSIPAGTVLCGSTFTCAAPGIKYLVLLWRLHGLPLINPLAFEYESMYRLWVLFKSPCSSGSLSEEKVRKRSHVFKPS
jgi:hypothetical protein